MPLWLRNESERKQACENKTDVVAASVEIEVEGTVWVHNEETEES